MSERLRPSPNLRTLYQEVFKKQPGYKEDVSTRTFFTNKLGPNAEVYAHEFVIPENSHDRRKPLPAGQSILHIGFVKIPEQYPGNTFDLALVLNPLGEPIGIYDNKVTATVNLKHDRQIFPVYTPSTDNLLVVHFVAVTTNFDDAYGFEIGKRRLIRMGYPDKVDCVATAVKALTATKEEDLINPIVAAST